MAKVKRRTPKSDPVNHPSHYTQHPSGVECIQIMEHMGFNLGNAFKYMFRHKHKGASRQDIEKAIWYIDREIERRTKETWAAYPLDARYEIASAGRVQQEITVLTWAAREPDSDVKEAMLLVFYADFGATNAVERSKEARADLKHDAIEDMRKAAWYIKREIKRRETKRAD